MSQIDNLYKDAYNLLSLSNIHQDTMHKTEIAIQNKATLPDLITSDTRIKDYYNNNSLYNNIQEQIPTKELSYYNIEQIPTKELDDSPIDKYLYIGCRVFTHKYDTKTNLIGKQGIIVELSNRSGWYKIKYDYENTVTSIRSSDMIFIREKSTQNNFYPNCQDNIVNINKDNNKRDFNTLLYNKDISKKKIQKIQISNIITSSNINQTNRSAPSQEIKIGAVVTAPALAFGAAFAKGAPKGKMYRGIIVDATDSDKAWIVRYDDDGLMFETETAFLTIVQANKSLVIGTHVKSKLDPTIRGIIVNINIAGWREVATTNNTLMMIRPVSLIKTILTFEEVSKCIRPDSQKDYIQARIDGTINFICNGKKFNNRYISANGTELKQFVTTSKNRSYAIKCTLCNDIFVDPDLTTMLSDIKIHCGQYKKNSLCAKKHCQNLIISTRKPLDKEDNVKVVSDKITKEYDSDEAPLESLITTKQCDNTYYDSDEPSLESQITTNRCKNITEDITRLEPRTIHSVPHGVRIGRLIELYRSDKDEWILGRIEFVDILTGMLKIAYIDGSTQIYNGWTAEYFRFANIANTNPQIRNEIKDNNNSFSI